MRIYVAGHTGLVGSALTRAIDSRSGMSWIGKTRRELDLTDRNSVFSYVKEERPDAIIISAAKVGGIMANKTYPVEFLSQNIQISTNLMNAAHESDIKRLVFLGSSCVYPKLSPQPIKEEYLLTGPLEETNEAYAIAKIAGIKLVEAYRRQHGREWISVMPTNLYGPGDNFDPGSSHVIPGLIRKFHDAKVDGLRKLTLWGSGNPFREFMYSGDAADGILHLLKNHKSSNLVNLGTGSEISIRELAAVISKEVGFSGEFSWDEGYPDGTPRKLLDTSILQGTNWFPKISLEEGVKATYRWFQERSS